MQGADIGFGAAVNFVVQWMVYRSKKSNGLFPTILIKILQKDGRKIFERPHGFMMADYKKKGQPFEPSSLPGFFNH